MKRRLIPLALLATLFASAPARAQDDNPMLPPFLQPAQDDPRARMIELFKKVETRLNEIDKLLYQAGSGEVPLQGAAESGIAELLQRSRAGGGEVLKGIDEILEIAAQNGGT